MCNIRDISSNYSTIYAFLLKLLIIESQKGNNFQHYKLIFGKIQVISVIYRSRMNNLVHDIFEVRFFGNSE